MKRDAQVPLQTPMTRRWKRKLEEKVEEDAGGEDHDS